MSRFSLSAAKTNTLLIHGGRKSVSNTAQLDIPLGGERVKQANSVKYLGLLIDDTLSWKLHINAVCGKVRPQLAALRRLSKQVPKAILAKIYTSVIEPTIDYGNTVWGNCPNVYINMIQKLQNSAARIVCGNFDYVNVRSEQLIRQLNWRTFRERHAYAKACLMYRCLNGLVPEYLSDCFTNQRDVFTYNFRRDHQNVVVPRPNKEIFKKSLTYSGAKLWNELPNILKGQQDLHSFKVEYKKHFYN